MEYKEQIATALQALRNNKLRTILTMIGIIIGISSVILIVSIGQGAIAFVTDQLASLGTNFFSVSPGSNSVSTFTGGTKNLTMDDVDAIRTDPSLTNIDVVAPAAIISAKASANDVDKTLLIRGVNQDIVSLLKPDMLYGEFLTDDDVLEERRVAVIGVDASETFFGKDTNAVGEKISIDDKNFTIIGVARTSNVLIQNAFNNTISIPISVALNQISGDVNINEVAIRVKNADIINQTMADVTALLRDRHNLKEGDENDFSIQSFRDALSTIRTVTNLLTTMVAAISGISLVVGGVGVMNIMLVSVTERTREIGLLKAIGAMEQDILVQFLVEAVVMTVIGGSIGILMGVFGAFLISFAVHIPFVVSIPSILVAVGVSMMVGVVFGLYPARRAARLSPIDALRFE